jgi:hypothetical protein
MYTLPYIHLMIAVERDFDVFTTSPNEWLTRAFILYLHQFKSFGVKKADAIYGKDAIIWFARHMTLGLTNHRARNPDLAPDHNILDGTLNDRAIPFSIRMLYKTFEESRDHGLPPKYVETLTPD